MSSHYDLHTLATYAAQIEIGDLPADVLSVAKACLLYGLAVGTGARRAAVCRLAIAANSGHGDENGATRLFDGRCVDPGEAVFANAVMMSARVQGDAHACGHVGGMVIPAALATAEHTHASGARLLAAIVAGYEVALRIGRDHAADLSIRGLRTSPCYGVFGAAAAAARTRGLTSTQMTSALALAANCAGGLREFVDAGTEESPFQSGFAARNGMHVSNLAAVDVVAAPSSLHGKAGFFNAYGNGGADYGARLVTQLGEQHEFTNVTFREYPANQFFRGIIRGMATLGQQAGRVEPKIIKLHMHPFEANFIGARYAGPYTSATQTVVSAPFCAALAWVTGTATFDALRRFDDDRVLRLIPRVELIADVSCARYEPRVEVELANGETLSWAEDAGAGSYRLTWDAATRMTYQLFDEVDVPKSLAQRLIEQAGAVDKLVDVMPLTSAVCAATLSS